MGKIHLIKNFEKIAAGEVIQRPASVVKELVENSLDANSTQIFITIKNAGKDLIKIEDNGIGIDEEDIVHAFLRHTSSKMDSADDLDNINTLGFRGEALASIVAISQVEIISRPKSQSYGIRLVMEDSEKKELEQCGSPEGTSMNIRNLFYNLPVRRKYLKSKQVELGHISDVITRYSLAYPFVHFRLIHNGLTLLNSTGYISPESAEKPKISSISLPPYAHSFQSIYGKKLFVKMNPIIHEDPYLRLYGYFGNPDLNRSDRYASSIFINHRLVRSPIILNIISDAYKGYLMRNRYPFVVIFLDIPSDQVDFNIHPSKQTVKFANEEKIVENLSHVWKIAIQSTFQSPEHSSQNISSQETYLDSKTTDIKNNFNQTQNQSSKTADHSSVNSSRPLSFQKSPSSQQSVKSSLQSRSLLKTPRDPQKRLIPTNSHKKKTQTRFNIGKTSFKSSNSNPYQENSNDLEQSETELNSSTLSEDVQMSSILTKTTFSGSLSNLPNVEYLNNGVQAGNTYLIFQNQEGLILVDQHAAHERINLEKITKIFEKDKISIQKLLSPIKIEVAPNETPFLIENLDNLSKMGFFLNHSEANIFFLNSVPSFFSQFNLDNSLIIAICLDLIHMGIESTFSNIKTEIIQFLACHHSLRGGDDIWDRRTIEKLLSDLDQCDNPGHCAHGRPTFIKIPYNELEKRFHRIV